MMKAQYCPRCKSLNVRVNVTAGAALGAPQQWECHKCGFTSYAVFPKKEIVSDSEEKLK